MSFGPLKGFRTMLPRETRRMRAVEGTLRRVFESYGYEEVQTPTLEPLSLFEQKSGEEIEKHMYTFVDKGGRRVALRPELTPSVARLYTSKSGELKLPVKWYYFSNAFRYEEPQRMRYREFWHAGVELIGASSVESDLEVLALTIDSMRGLGFSHFRLRLGDVRIMKGFLASKGCGPELQGKVLLVIDKRGKVPRQKFEEMLFSALEEDEGLFDEVKDMIFAGGDPSTILPYLEGIKPAEQAVERLSKLLGTMKDMGMDRWMEFSPSLVRGILYYTGMVFEVYLEDEPFSLGGGGRYDELVSLYGGPSVPCVGLSFGVDRLREVMDDRGLFETLEPSVAFVSYATREALGYGLEVARTLRLAGISTDMELRSRSLARQLEYADKKGCPLAIIVGEREMKSRKVRLKDLSTGQEVDIPLGELLSRVKKRIGMAPNS